MTQSGNRTIHPGQRSGRLTAMLAVLTLAGLGLAACSNDGEAPDQADQQHDLDALLAADARGDQLAAGGAVAMAMELGFNQVQTAAESELTAVRDNAADRADTAQELNVEPASCAEPIAALDWSPILASSEAITRVDFGTGEFTGAGSVEVAGITEATGGSAEAADEVAAHQQAVEEITTTCNDLTMMLADESEPDWADLEYTFSAEAVETDSGSGLLWQREPTEDGAGQETTALTVMTEHEGYAIQVAFIGGDDITDDEFTDLTEAILASAVAQLDTDDTDQ